MSETSISTSRTFDAANLFQADGAHDRMPLFMANVRPDRSSAILLAVSDLLGREVAVDSLLRVLVERICRAMNADRGTLYLVDCGKGEVFSKAAHLPELEEIRLHLGQGIAGHVAATGEVVNVPTTCGEERFFAGVDEQTGYCTRSVLAAPMRDKKGMIIGVVQLLNKRGGPFDREDEEALATLAAQAAIAIEATTIYGELNRSPADAKESVPLADRFNRIIGESEPMRQAYRLTTKAAASVATVLIRGESGIGKELFARAVHVNSPRKAGSFVKVDCAALPVSLIENELFGHEKGAYTGADQRAEGKFDAAKGGTIFLDEIGELPLSVQGKLLRVLQDREFERVGGTKTVHADVRVVAATNRDLEKLVEDGRFRADLYYRIKVVEIRLPSLRARGPEDIARLSRHFVALAAKRHGREVPRLSVEALRRLTSYSWPGNVRELENCLESAVVVMDGSELLPEYLPLPERPPVIPGTTLWFSDGVSANVPPPLVSASPPVPANASASPGGGDGKALADVEREHILAVLEQVDGNRSLAAKRLGLGRNTLTRKLKAYGL